MEKQVDNSKRCDFCKYYDERFDDFGHLTPARCKKHNRFTNSGGTCIDFKHMWEEDNFFTDINDDD